MCVGRLKEKQGLTEIEKSRGGTFPCMYASSLGLFRRLCVQGWVINIGERKESFCACIFVHAKDEGRWMHANVHVLCTVHACMGLDGDADKGER